MGDRFGGIDLFGFHNPFGGDLIGPAEDQNNWKPQPQDHEHHRHKPFWEGQIIRGNITDLNNNPTDHRVSNRHPDNVSAL